MCIRDSEEEASGSDDFILTDLMFTPISVQNKLLRLNANKARGPDGIPPRVLKELHAQLANPL